jgi:hypothetical protein
MWPTRSRWGCRASACTAVTVAADRSRRAPGADLTTRIRFLLLATRKSSELAKFLEGIEYDGISAAPPSPSVDEVQDAELESLAQQRYLSLESEQLSHHACETLLRLFLAHRHIPSVPWVEMTALTSFAKFKALVEEIRTMPPESLVRDVTQVFLGQPGAEDTIVACEGVTTFMRIAAGHLLDHSRLYNSVKHGLAIQAQASAISFGETLDSLTTLAEGPALRTLERESVKESDGSSRTAWYLKDTWIDIRWNMWVAELATSCIESLWRIARWRYLGTEPDELKLITTDIVDAIQTGHLRRRSNGVVFRHSISALPIAPEDLNLEKAGGD